MPAQPLSALLSQALVAFTIEFDNETEHQLPHRTTVGGATRGALHAPWLVSLVMWMNCMRFIDEKGVTVGRLEDFARTSTNLNGMERWGYIVIAPDPADRRPKPPRSAWVIHATPAGRMAQEIWRPMFTVIEERWNARFGKDAIDPLRQSLAALVSQMDPALPDCLPILGYGLFSKGLFGKAPRGAVPPGPFEDVLRFPLSTLLSRVLLAFAIEYEREPDVSLAIGANILRVLTDTAVRVRDLPGLTGVSKEAIAMALGFLGKKSFATVEPERMGSRVKVARLSAKGLQAQDQYRQLTAVIEKQWRLRFGSDVVSGLRASLEQLAGAPLFRGLEPWPGGWRAKFPRPGTLPHYPMVLHRGGFPDGS